MNRKKKRKTKPIKGEIQGLVVEKNSFVAGIMALNIHLEEIMSEYTKIREHVGNDDEHPVLQSLQAQAELINDIVNCFETSILHGDTEKPQRGSIN